MRIPSYEVAECPNCNRPVSIPITSAYRYFLGDSGWRCPHCKDYVTTEEIHDHNDKRED